MDQYFEVSRARIRQVKRVQFSVLSPEELVSTRLPERPVPPP